MSLQTQAIADRAATSLSVVDADTHVDENEETWSHMEEHEQQYRPVLAKLPSDDGFVWIYEGVPRRVSVRDDLTTHTTKGTRELVDIDGRLRDMDRMGVATQVIYSSFFLGGTTELPEAEVAMRRSYNRWMAERCARSGGRLRWVMLPPWMTIDKAVDEVRWAKDHGAVGVHKKGDREAGHWPAEEYNFPVYAEAEKLDMPITFHTGTGSPLHIIGGVSGGRSTRLLPSGVYYDGSIQVEHAFQSLVRHGVPAMFPKLRWGFIEAGSSWVPNCLYNLRHMMDERRKREVASMIVGGAPELETSGNILARNNLYVACQTDEDLPYILKQCGEDNLMIGSDYCHNDYGTQIEFSVGLQRRADAGDIPQTAVQKIMVDNPRRFYAL